MSQRVSKRRSSRCDLSKTKGNDTDDKPHIEHPPKKNRLQKALTGSLTNELQLDQTTTTTTTTTTTVTTAPDSPPYDENFEADMAKAMKLSIMSAEKLCDTAILQEASRLDQHQPQQQCPLCNAHMKVSENDFERHVNRCLDQSNDTASIPTTPSSTTTTTTTTAATERQKVSSWGQIFQSIPNTLHNSWIGKMVSTVDNSSSDIASTSVLKTPTPIPAPTPTLDMNSYNGNTAQPRRRVPAYKWMKDTKFIVDAFNYGKIPNCDGYFLTHFHSDHYGGLNHSWSAGPIYCSQVTANLVHKELDVEEQYLHVLPMNESIYVLPHVKVTLIDANHCPGSVLFIFDIQQQSFSNDEGGNNISTWVRHLHTGDFRANPRMCLHPLLRQPENPTIDHLYLDTTYLNAKYGFPAQEECIEAACRVIEVYMGVKDENRPKTMLEQWMGKQTTTTATTASEDSNTNASPSSVFDTMMSNAKLQKKTEGLLVVVGTYSIGKEKVFYAIAKLLKSKIYVTAHKRYLLKCQENPELENMLTDDPLEAHVHIVPLNHIKAENMHAYMKKLSPRFTNMIAFRPTGWTYRPSKAQATEMSIGSLSQVTIAPTDRTLYLKPSHSSPTLKIYGVPYSEHSSFRELASFIASLNINHVVPTVNYEAEKGQQRMLKYLEKWQQDKQGKPINIVPYPAESHW
ncbi:DNA repair metallo-beta-lactamase-domain-containing protein [Absidia repens]|uniref:DNA repair metallo-beta-lactamase-domain-containing protein n=1 Tax=Absidia repens TaxID=90262 RepID=A0A1X2HYL0_9FUNG|nr:DNA repair metallo-beta-lactamase-domain-containing protein [Absidia repens]